MRTNVMAPPRACERRASSRQRARISGIDTTLPMLSNLRIDRGSRQGGVKMCWGALASKKSYMIERAPTQDGPWTLVHVGRRAMVELADQPTLCPLWFRVAAAFGTGKTGPFSEPAGIVLPGPDWYDSAYPEATRSAIAKAKALLYVEPVSDDPSPLHAEQQIARLRLLATLVADNADIFDKFPAQPVEMFRMADEMEQTHRAERLAFQWLRHAEAERKRAEAKLLEALERNLEQSKLPS